MKVWSWFKSLSWIAIGGLALAAIGMVARAFAAGAMEAEVAADEKEIDRLNTGTTEDIKAAARLQVMIGAKKDKAREIRKKAEKHQERIGQNETMADIADRFNNKSMRVRSRKDAAAEL